MVTFFHLYDISKKAKLWQRWHLWFQGLDKSREWQMDTQRESIKKVNSFIVLAIMKIYISVKIHTAVHQKGQFYYMLIEK